MTQPDSNAGDSVGQLYVGQLYVVGTPIGNLEDMSFRAIRVLQSVDLIAAEDTRHTGRLLQHFQISTPQISYHQHNSQQRLTGLLSRLRQGQTLALVSDAGMPGISDPGYELVQACVAAEIIVTPIPGPCAAITALSAAGLPTTRFCFEGFLPIKGAARRRHLEQLRQESRTMVFYESPHRLRQTLQDFANIFGDERVITLARELTKRYETFWQGSLASAVARYEQETPRGEFTLVLAGNAAAPVQPTDAELRRHLQQLIDAGLSPSQACRQLAQTANVSRRYLYQLSLDLS